VVLVAGSRLTHDGFVEGWADLDGATVRATGRGDPPRPADLRGALVPAPVNAHTHLGDAALRGQLDPTLGLDALVKPPSGLKHRLLAETPESVLEDGMRRAIDELREAGARMAVDFREGGAPGVAALTRAARARKFPVRILGRARSGHPDDLTAVVLAADGVGIPAVDDLSPGEAKRWADAAHARGKLVAVHASEGRREPIDPVLDLRPHHVVHMTCGSVADFEALAKANVTLVACPRSNALLVKRIPDVTAMLQAGCRVALGTDNASLQRPSVFEELAFLRASARVAERDLLRVAFFGWPEPEADVPSGAVEGARGPWLVLKSDGKPEDAALAPAPTILRTVT
jgi:cytosine/adenosine deaminase-related metal-dependent hydrolase